MCMFTGVEVSGTTPLEMNVGQQKYVVSYTLKGKEKQPDILNAQKSAVEINDTIFKMKSPAVLRPDDLFATSSSSSMRNQTDNFSQNHPQQQQQQIIHNLMDMNSQSYMTHNQAVTTHYNIHPPPYSQNPFMNNDYETPLKYSVNYNFESGGALNSTSDSENASRECNNLNSLFNCSTVNSGDLNSHFESEILENTENYLQYEKALHDNAKLNNDSASRDNSSKYRASVFSKLNFMRNLNLSPEKFAM